jgi:uncharacterized membrane protein
MSYKTFRMVQAFIGMAIGSIMGVSVAEGNWIIPIPTIIIAMVVIIVLRRRVKEIVQDERTYAVAYKAARLTLAVTAIGMAVVGAVLLAASRGGSSDLRQVGFALEYATCGLLIINYITYAYYDRKLGGK